MISSRSFDSSDETGAPGRTRLDVVHVGEFKATTVETYASAS